MAASNEMEVKSGWELYQRGDWAGAERCCQNILSASPTYGGALGLLGILRLTTGRADEAAALLTQALKGKPRDATLLGALGLARLMQGDAGAAEKALRGALKWGNHDDALLHMRLGMALGAQGHAAQAVVELRHAQLLAPDNPDVLLNLANAVVESGQGSETEQLLRRVLMHKPDHGDARFNLGTLYMRLGRLDEAAAEFRTLLDYYPNSADAHNNLGIVLERQLHREQAEKAYRMALALDENNISAMNNLGNVLRTQGRADEALDCYAQAIRAMPDHADGYLNQGILRASQNLLDEACTLFCKALSADPRCIEAEINLAEVYRRKVALGDAIEALRRALAIDPDSAIALNGLGNVLRMQGHLGDAADCYSRAMRATPRDPSAFLNLGILRALQGQYGEACALLRQAVKVDEKCAQARLKLAEVLRISGHLDESRQAYQQLLLQQPQHAAASAGLAHVRQHLCDWEGIEKLWDDARNALGCGEDIGITPFSALSIPTTPQEQLACARAWARREFGWIIKNSGGNNECQPYGAIRDYQQWRDGNAGGARNLRLGYLSWDYHEHATAYLMAEVFELHDRERFTVTAYSYGPDDGSAIRQRIRGACDAFIDIAGVSEAEAARRIAADNIDILIDLKGYTLGARTPILAYRPAPVQVNWLGFPGTMGTECIDWILADHFIIPEGAEQNYAEQVYRLPDCYQPNDRKREIGAAPTRAECGLPDAGVVFCCFNQAYKILPETFGAWMRILHRVPGSVLWLLETGEDATRNLRLNAAAHGVSAERIVFAPRQPLAAHLARYRIADLALDTFPYTSHTTASDALWAGCPLVTRVGDTFASRVAGSVLNAVGLSELITSIPTDFEELAVQIALAPERRARLRQYLEQGRKGFALFDTPRLVAHLENAYQTMRKSWLDRSGLT